MWIIDWSRAREKQRGWLKAAGQRGGEKRAQSRNIEDSKSVGLDALTGQEPEGEVKDAPQVPLGNLRTMGALGSGHGEG